MSHIILSDLFQHAKVARLKCARFNQPDDKRHDGRDRLERPKIPDVARAVKEGIDKAFIDEAAAFGPQLNISNSQLRGFFTEVKHLQARTFDKEEFLMLRPRLQYAVMRNKEKDNDLESLQNALRPAINEVVAVNDADQDKRFTRFCLCFEAIVAYAKKKSMTRRNDSDE
ncbi:MAG: type III-A CRISPR-associated protein Csm2 [Candidatus Sumerlaeota bacterium]|nr:type III-A CRISPR-associated protein Csm2 [Candidatus Sumerlaeota bacterium]